MCSPYKTPIGDHPHLHHDQPWFREHRDPAFLPNPAALDAAEGYLLLVVHSGRIDMADVGVELLVMGIAVVPELGRE